MRRGLMGWTEADLPLAVLKQRLSRVQDCLKGQGLGGLVLYTNLARPAAVSFLTGFTPYWSEGLLLVPAAGDPVFATALSKRVSEWIRSVMPIGSIENTPQPAAAIGRRLTAADVRRVGVLELDLFPAAQAAALTATDAVALEDATDLFRTVRMRVDAAEIALVRRANELARQCLETVDRGGDARAMMADIEARARLAGAEEVFVGIAPDLARSTAFLRSDRLGALGARFAIRLSLSLKGAWVRRTITLGRVPEAQAKLAAADAAFARALVSPSPADALKALEEHFPGTLTAWSLEACVGSYPLEVVARSGGSGTFSGNLPVSVVSAQGELDGLPWLGAGPVIGEAQP